MKSPGIRKAALVCCLSLSAACQPRKAPAPPPGHPALNASVTPVSPDNARVEPPPAGVVPDAPFPAIQKRALDNGLAVQVIERRIHPLIEIRLVVQSGAATSGDKPGLAVIAGELLKAGGAGGMSPLTLIERAESLGTDLNILTDRDSTRISLNVTTGQFEEALAILSAVALRPAFLATEFQKLREREVERVKSSARGSATWAASMVLYRELYSLPTRVHPYARYDALPSDLERITLADCRNWHKKHFVPSNATLVVVGDVTAEQVFAVAGTALSSWTGESAPKPSFSRPFPQKERSVYLVDRPGSAQSQIYVGMLGPERKSADWPGLAVANQILGGGVSGRLFEDIREKRSLAYSTGSALGDLATGPVPMVLTAGTQTPKTTEAVRALLENLEGIVRRAPSEAEVARARTFLSDSFVFQLETVGSVADLASDLVVLGLPEDYYDEYRESVRGLGAKRVEGVASKRFAETPIIVVAGDATAIGAELASFGPVSVLDPEKGFALKRSFPKKP